MRTGKQQCPQCQHTRKHNPKDKPLSVHSDNGELFYKCHHCQWKGKITDGQPQNRTYTKPDYRPTEAGPTEKLLTWFASRGIPPAIVKRRQIESREVILPQTGKLTRCIAFPYFRNGEVVNVKYRSADKLFRMESGAELTFYGLDDLDPECVVIVEGEPDCLAVETAGISSVLSVPNGTGTNLDILTGVESQFEQVKKFIIAGDSDPAGRQLQQELVRRLGAERCWRTEWPEGCKDANEVLMKHGADEVRRCIDKSRPVPIEGAFEVLDILDSLGELYDFGRPRGLDPGWSNLREYYQPRCGQWTVITGSPGAGKSAFLRALLVNLALEADWQFAIFPPEDLPPAEYVSQLIEVYLGKPFDDGPTQRMSKAEMLEAAEWVHDHFVILNPSDDFRDFDSLLKLAKQMVYRRGINGFVIDPWNEIEHQRSAAMSETQYIEACLVKMRAFSQLHGLHNWIIAHPTKLSKNESGVYPVATLYDVAGSAHWFNKADFGLSIWRDKSDDKTPVEIHVQKVRSRWCGQLGMVQLYYSKVTGQYWERPGDQPTPRLPYSERDYEVIN